MSPEEQAVVDKAVDAGFTDDEIRQVMAERRRVRDPRPHGVDPRNERRGYVRPGVEETDHADAGRLMVPQQGGIKTERNEYLEGPDPQAARRKEFNDLVKRQVAGSVAGAALGELGGALLRPLANAGPAGTVAARAVTGAGSGAGAAAAGDVATDTPITKKDILLGAALGGGAGIATGSAEAIRSPLTRTGRQIAAIEAVGGRSAVTRGYPKGAAGTGRMAAEEEGRIHDMLENRRQAAGTDLGDVENQVASDLGDRPIDTSDEIQRLQGIRDQRMGGAGPTIPEADRAVSNAQRQLTNQAPTEPTVRPRFPGDPRAAAGGEAADVTENNFRQLRNLHKALNEAADAGGQVGDLATGARRQAASIVRGAVRRADPRMEAALDEYTAEMDRLSGANDRLYGTEGPVPSDRAGKARAGTSRLASAGTEGSPGQQAIERQLDEVAAIDPVAANAIRRMRGRNAAEATRFGLPTPTGSALGTAARAVGQNTDAALTRIIEPAADFLGASPPDLVPLEIMLIENGRLKRKRQETSP